ncbi:hypothetical protein OROGR_027513 [Orobanche gracilis]
MSIFIRAYDIELWKVICLGPKIATEPDDTLKSFEDFDDADWKDDHFNCKATQLLYCALNPEEVNRISSCDSAREIWKILEITHKGTSQVKETKINMLLHEYELFQMLDDESITTMLDRFSVITNGLASFGKPLSSSEKVKKILRSLPSKWDGTVTAIMESKDLNTLDFSALVGSLINHEIVLKSRNGKPKPKEKTIALKAKTSRNEDSLESVDDEEAAFYAKNMNRFKNLYHNRQNEIKSGGSKKFDMSCQNCGKQGHFARECRAPKKQKEVLVATWSDEEDENDVYSGNIALMARSTFIDSAEEENECIFERFRGILHEGEIDKRVQFLIEGLFALRKAKFQGYPAVRPELDLVDQEDQLTHEVSLLDEINPEESLHIFQPDPNFSENEKRYEELKRQILGEESEDEADSDQDVNSDDQDDEESEEENEEQMKIKDETETNLINLRRTIYLTIMSSVDFEEAGHKLLKIKLEPGQEMELCIMLLECCSQERTYLRYYGLLGQRFCMINKIHQENFEKCFVEQYSMIHRLETNKLRNVAKFFAHLLGTDALPWHVLSYIRLTEEYTTSSSRIFIKILFQELSEHLGIRLLNERLSDPAMQGSFESIFPRDTPKNTRFAINFFTSIGLGGITENLREYLKNMPRLIMQQQKAVAESDPESGSSSSDSDGSGSASSSSTESESDSDVRRRRKKRRN